MRALSLSQVGLALHYLSVQAGKPHRPGTPMLTGLSDKLVQLVKRKRSPAYMMSLLQRELESGELPASRTGPY